MSQPNSDRERFNDLYTKFAELEYRMKRIENTTKQIEDTMTPGGYITDSFERVSDDIEALRIEMNSKLEIVLSHITKI
jgi:hypothetical protein